MLAYLTSPEAKKYISRLEEVFSSLPKLPQNFIDFLVRVLPWLVALGGILSALSVISSLRLALGMTPNQELWNEIVKISPIYYYIGAAVQAGAAFLAYLAFNPLKEQKLEGWIYVFWTSILSLVSTAAAIIFASGSIVWSIFWVLVGWYLLFQIKPAYNGGAVKADAATKPAAKKTKKSAK